MNRMTDFRGKPVPQSTIVRLAMIINALFLLGLTSSSTSLRDPGTSGIAVGTGTGSGVGTGDGTTVDGVVPGDVAGEPGAVAPDGTVVLPSGERVPASSAPGAAGRPGATTGGGGGGTNTTTGIERVGQGVSADTINIGITLFKVGGFGAAFGAGNVDFGDTEAQARAAVAHINDTGGLAGRKVNPIFYTFDFGRPGLADGQSEQEACALWTEDNKTFAVINYVMARHALMTCLAARDVPGIHMGMPIDEGLLSKHRRYWYAGNNGAGLTLERQASVQAKVYGERGWFGNGKDAVVGIQYFDDPAYKKVVDEQFIPNIKKYGVEKFVLQAAPRGGSDGAQYAARFQREGVTHVLFLGEAALYPIFFMQGAENQGYRPKYGITTDMAPAVLLQITVPQRQLENAIGVGWQPMSDTDADNDPGPVSARQTLCHDVMRKAGQDMSKRGAALTALNYCSGLWMLQDSLKTTKDITSVGLERALEGLGNRWVSPVVYGTDFAFGHDGVTKYRDLAFKDGAFYYSSGVKDMPR